MVNHGNRKKTGTETVLFKPCPGKEPSPMGFQYAVPFLMGSHIERIIAIVLRIHILPARVSLCETMMH